MQAAAEWHDRANRMPTYADADENKCIWAWMDDFGLMVVSIRQFEDSPYLKRWHPRIKQPRPEIAWEV